MATIGEMMGLPPKFKTVWQYLSKLDGVWRDCRSAGGDGGESDSKAYAKYHYEIRTESRPDGTMSLTEAVMGGVY